MVLCICCSLLTVELQHQVVVCALIFRTLTHPPFFCTEYIAAALLLTYYLHINNHRSPI
jgi:hypothetical protein